ncbi:PEP-CTERM sorting domain-containing protein [Denitromonas halophila]|uniref:PEP-CTERM sorting domain-containing protein n=1 Tax=Denitromonas halophila TaxID=1629404 RepID=A0A557QIF9_9RHOO|nr:PEP-CTERM sorting domain-containing protein [Denitromonas halophila]TVO52685.1 PEP-CTERM sorting domain-containing protein [Denitromonas halophila]
MTTFKTKALVAMLALTGSAVAQAAVISFSDADLGSGNPVTVGGTTLTTTNTGGSIGFITSGTFAGLYLGGNNTSGSYVLSFSTMINSIEIEFDALSSVGSLPVETLFGFVTSNGPVSIGYTNQGGTTFDGTTITSTANDGQGTISFSGTPFNSFSFNHNQGAQSGFVIERVLINTADMPPTSVPEPVSLGLLGIGLLGLGLVRGKRKA